MKVRLDDLLVQRKLAATIKEAKALIGAGSVLVENTVSDKAGSTHNQQVDIIVKRKGRYVSRGGLKLEKGLSFFEIDVTGWTCVDIGASSGGFTDCLLQHGAKRVYAVDVGYGQLDWKLRQDSRVVVLERCNGRNLTNEHVPEKIDFAVIDASFISLTKLLPPLFSLFESEVRIVGLIKPQFELPKKYIEHGGVVRQKSLHDQAIEDVSHFCLHHGLATQGTVLSPILGPRGNKEFLISLRSA